MIKTEFFFRKNLRLIRTSGRRMIPFKYFFSKISSICGAGGNYQRNNKKEMFKSNIVYYAYECDFEMNPSVEMALNSPFLKSH